MTTLAKSHANPTATRAAAPAAKPVSIRGVSRVFTDQASGQPHEVLADINLEIASGEILALLGASGCGKSTLLRQICGLDTPSTGTILIDGSPVAGIDQRCAIGFQEPRLLPWRSLARNVALGLPAEVDRHDGAERVAQLLGVVGLAEFIDHRPRQVSGGMAQRASLARALARNPGVLLLDEPFGALDALTRLQMQDLLLDIHQAEPTTVIMVTHDVDEALYLADRVVLLGQPATAASAAAAGPAAGLATAPGASVVSINAVPGARPRDRGAPRLIELRAKLLAELGVPQRGPSQSGPSQSR